MDDLNQQYRTQGWGKITDEALGILPENVESQARQVARWAHKKIEAQTAEIASLRAQLAHRIDPREMLRWENHGCFLGNLVVGSMCLKVDGWVGQAGENTVVHRATESEARSAVERAVLEALGVSQETGQ